MMLEKIATRGGRSLLRLVNRRAFEQDFMRTLPGQMHEPARLLFYGDMSAKERRIAKRIESFRTHIPRFTATSRIQSYSSPHSSTFQVDASGHAVPGPNVLSPVEATVRTGVGPHGGILLRRIVQGLQAGRVLELGTNTGFSGGYFLSVPNTELVTVEGSPELCAIAEHNLRRISERFRIMNMLFDEAIDQLLAEGILFDAVYIDGQHEREATLHYAARVRPLVRRGGALIFDDIYWSDGMNQCWKELCSQSDVAHSIDLCGKGVCMLGTPPLRQVHHDVGDYVGRPRIFRKGW